MVYAIEGGMVGEGWAKHLFFPLETLAKIKDKIMFAKNLLREPKILFL